MFILRSVEESDLDSLYELSQLMIFINLPSDRGLIEQKIARSIISFKTPSQDLAKNYYIFVLEDTQTKKVVGVSMVHAQHGTESEPHFFLQVDQEHKYSQTLNTGFVHGTLKLGMDQNGPTEIGGLILHPDFRKSPEKFGKQISFTRFLYMAIHPSKFKSEIHSELLPPLDKKGNPPLWEAVGRRFMNMNYHEADILSRANKEFILSLFPSDNIYQTLLSLEARDAIGKVGKDTVPVKKMLESIGFSYINQVDPFDGGPHYRCELDKIKPIKDKITGILEQGEVGENATAALVHIPNKEHDFLAIKAMIEFKENKIILNPEIDSNFTIPWGKESIAINFASY